MWACVGLIIQLPCGRAPPPCLVLDIQASGTAHQNLGGQVGSSVSRGHPHLCSSQQRTLPILLLDRFLKLFGFLCLSGVAIWLGTPCQKSCFGSKTCVFIVLRRISRLSVFDREAPAKTRFPICKSTNIHKKTHFSPLSAEYHKIEWHYGWGLPFKNHHFGPKSPPKPIFFTFFWLLYTTVRK